MTKRRFSKRQRTELWLASLGCCAICGRPLGELYHADHRRPWARGGLTVNANGQATCPDCNLKKGGRMLRTHQQQLLDACRRIKASPLLRKVIAVVVPGGGKSALPVIAAHELIPAIGDGLAWISPRTNLRTQAEEAFTAGWLRSILGHQSEIRASINDADLLRGKIGYATTYQALTHATSYRINPHVELFDQRRMILVLDEAQHVEINGEFHNALVPLIDRCAALILMSGGLSRHDNRRVACLDYLDADQQKRSFVDLGESEQQTVIRYGLRDATREHAIIKINFELRDCSADWEIHDPAGDVVAQDAINSFDDATLMQTGKALFTALDTEFFDALLYDAIEFWRDRRKHNPRSLFLVVVPYIHYAKKAVKMLQQMGLNVGIATSEDLKDAPIAIERFRHVRRPYLDGLVTVAMAYEGMDAPQADVLACLTHVRSRQWIEQMIHRITRFDVKNTLPWEHQFATIFAPKDKFFLNIMAEMQSEQAPFVQEATAPAPPAPPSPSGNKLHTNQSEMTGSSAHTFDDAPIEAETHQRVTDALKLADIYGAIPTSAAQKFFEAMNVPQSQPGAQATASADFETPTRREKKLRVAINRLLREGYDKNDPQLRAEGQARIQRRGRAMFKIHNKRLEEMTEAEMRFVLDNKALWMVP